MATSTRTAYWLLSAILLNLQQDGIPKAAVAVILGHTMATGATV